jgi:hypothetical protein
MTDLPSIRITRTVEYVPEFYLQYCEENELNPNKEDFYSFIEEWINNDFSNAFVDQKIEYVYE